MCNDILKRIKDKKVPLYYLITLLFIFFIYEGFSYYKSDIDILNNKVIGNDVGIYWDQSGDNSINSINWGNLKLNQSQINKSISIYIKNKLNRSVILNLKTNDWRPSSSKRSINVNWNYSQQILQPKDIIKIKITLSVNQNIRYQIPRITSYNFNLIISAHPL